MLALGIFREQKSFSSFQHQQSQTIRIQIVFKCQPGTSDILMRLRGKSNKRNASLNIMNGNENDRNYNTKWVLSTLTKSYRRSHRLHAHSKKKTP